MLGLAKHVIRMGEARNAYSDFMWKLLENATSKTEKYVRLIFYIVPKLYTAMKLSFEL
jgi:hypothetical protein